MGVCKNLTPVCAAWGTLNIRRSKSPLRAVNGAKHTVTCIVRKAAPKYYPFANLNFIGLYLTPSISKGTLDAAVITQFATGLALAMSHGMRKGSRLAGEGRRYRCAGAFPKVDRGFLQSHRTRSKMEARTRPLASAELGQFI
ncbi:hypothetical protein TNCV_2548521 [Trichonephila clavipes]|nr:hypothetical protein TNCV_2548521 [Trichonephila clavipes]